jgi:hypothetical protein
MLSTAVSRGSEVPEFRGVGLRRFFPEWENELSHFFSPYFGVGVLEPEIVRRKSARFFLDIFSENSAAFCTEPSLNSLYDIKVSAHWTRRRNGFSRL